MMALEEGKDTHYQFRIERFDGGYFAVRDESPRFALAAPTAGEAAEIAVRAIEHFSRHRQAPNYVGG